MRLRSDNPARGGYVLLAVLVVIVVLSLVAYRFTDSMTTEYRAAVRTGEAAQAKFAAVSGLHFAAAVLSDRETFVDELGAYPYDNPDFFEQYEVVSAGAEPTRRAYFSIRAVAPGAAGTPEQRFGVTDEAGKLNINSLIALDKTGLQLHDALMKLEPLGMTEDLADAIVDWVDSDDEARASGAESDYYLSLPQPYKAKNGPLNTLDELLLVKGMTPYLLYGGDRNRNGVLDEGEEDTTRGLSDYLTVYGRELNVDSTGVQRIFLNGNDPDTMYEQLDLAVGPEMAAYIYAAKVWSPSRIQTTTGTLTTGDGTSMTVSFAFTQPGQRPTVEASPDALYEAAALAIEAGAKPNKDIRSILRLINTQIKLPRPQGTPNDAPDLVANCPLNDPETRKTLLPLLLDTATVQQAIELVPRVNVNTAPREVLLALTNPRDGSSLLTDEEVELILTNRVNQPPADLATTTGAWLVTTDTLSSTKFRQVERYITGRTMVYRVQSVGYLDSGGPVARMEAVIDTNQGAPRFLYVRDLGELDNPRGFQPPQMNR